MPTFKLALALVCKFLNLDIPKPSLNESTMPRLFELVLSLFCSPTAKIRLFTVSNSTSRNFGLVSL